METTTTTAASASSGGNNTDTAAVRAAQHAASVALHADRVRQIAAAGGSLRKSKYVPRSLAQHRYTDRSAETPDSIASASAVAVADPSLSFTSDFASSSASSSAGAGAGTSRGGVSALFPVKLHQAIARMESEGNGHVLSWQPHGRAFVVHRPREFESLMPRYFGKMKFSSFQRQLNLYGFMRLTHGPDKGGYYHEYFLRGKEFLTERIARIRVKGTGSRAASNPDQEPNFYAMAPVGCVGVGVGIGGGIGADQPPPPASSSTSKRPSDLRLQRMQAEFERRQRERQQAQMQRARQHQMQQQQQRVQQQQMQMQQRRQQLRQMARHPSSQQGQQQSRSPALDHMQKNNTCGSSSSILPALVPTIAPPVGGFSGLPGPPPRGAGLPPRQISADAALGGRGRAHAMMAPRPLQRSSSVAAALSSHSLSPSPLSQHLPQQMLAQMRRDQPPPPNMMDVMMPAPVMPLPRVMALPERSLGQKQASLQEDDLRLMLERPPSSSSGGGSLPPRPQMGGGGLRRSSSATTNDSAAAASISRARVEEVPSSSEHDDLLSGDALSEHDDDLRSHVEHDDDDDEIDDAPDGEGGVRRQRRRRTVAVEPLADSELDDTFWDSMDDLFDTSSSSTTAPGDRAAQRRQQQPPPPPLTPRAEEGHKSILEELESLPEDTPSKHGMGTAVVGIDRGGHRSVGENIGGNGGGIGGSAPPSCGGIQRPAFSMRRLSMSLSQISEVTPLSAPPPPVDGDIADFLKVLFENKQDGGGASDEQMIIPSAEEEKESTGSNGGGGGYLSPGRGSGSPDSEEVRDDVTLGGSWNAAAFARRGTFKRQNSWSSTAA